MLFFILILALLIIVGSVWWMGVWNIFLNLIITLLSGLIASSFYSNLAEQINSADRTFRYISEFLAVWILFAFSFVVLRAITEVISNYKMKLDIVTEMFGRSILAIWLGCVFVSFASFTLHLAPVPPNYIQAEDGDVNFAVGPDRFWLAFIQSRSRGALAESKESIFSDYKLEDHPDDVELDSRVFDPKSRFVLDRMENRRQMSRNDALRMQ